MSDVFDYLKWRDDIPLDELNDVDILIFNRIAYFPFEEIMNEREEISLSEGYERSIKVGNLHYSNEKDERLFRITAMSERYGSLVIKRVVSKLDIEKEEQFMALTIVLPKGSVYVSFRGTTSDIVGWKEDFNMAFMDVPSQRAATEYLNGVTEDKIYVGGHSKGGNLAVYAGILANDEIRKKIAWIYNFDGPGLREIDDRYREMKERIITYLPSDSVVGRIFALDNDVIVVKSRTWGIGQHDLYSWVVEKKSFVLSNLTKESNKIKSIIDEFLERLSLKERRVLVDGVYGILRDSGIKSTKDISILQIRDIILSYNKIDTKSKELLLTIFGILWSTTIDSFRGEKKKQ